MLPFFNATADFRQFANILHIQQDVFGLKLDQLSHGLFISFHALNLLISQDHSIVYTHASFTAPTSVTVVSTGAASIVSPAARFSSPLSVDDFVKKSQYTYFTADALKDLAEDVAYFAQTEGLTGHARSAMIRLEEDR